jgi:hypothetical protein
MEAVGVHKLKLAECHQCRNAWEKVSPTSAFLLLANILRHRCSRISLYLTNILFLHLGGGGPHACAKDAAHIYGEKSSSGMMQLWPYTLSVQRNILCTRMVLL